MPAGGDTGKRFEITVGEKLITPTNQLRTYLFAVTPTGQTQHIKDTGKVKQLSFTRGAVDNAIEYRVMRISYEIISGIVTLQMRCIRTQFGRQRESVAFNFEVGNSDFPLVEIGGFEDFGGFRGYARLPNLMPEGITVRVITPGTTKEDEPQMGLIW